MRYEKDDEVMLVIASNIEMERVPGSTPFTAVCGCPTWVSPTGMAAVMDKRTKTEVVCWRHAPSGAVNDLFSNRKTPTLQGARHELGKALGWREGERIARRFNFGREY
jgi:hypothetical protein